MKNIFIEGIQGTGKSTLMNQLEKELPQYRIYREGDLSPAELAWCSYMSQTQFDDVLKKFPDFAEDIITHTVSESDMKITSYTQILTDTYEFYQYMEKFEIYNGRVTFDKFKKVIFDRYAALSTTGNVFECSFFQNSLECMMLFYEMSELEIIEFYKEANNILKDKNYLLLYLASQNIREDILTVKRERCDVHGKELWFQLVMDYLKTSPYGVKHKYSELNDLIYHLEQRKQLEERIIQDVLGTQAIIIKSKSYDMNEVMNGIKERG